MYHTGKTTWLQLLILVFISAACSQKLVPDKPFLSGSPSQTDSLPDSEINIPIHADLKPIYQIAEKNVPLNFTSPHWPDDWITINCASRYKYYLRRGPLQFNSGTDKLNIGFTGFYKIAGATRACFGNTVLSPWTPPCSCGFEDGEKKVNINFSHSFSVLPDYRIRSNIKRDEPVPLDKCQVCFFGADITSLVMDGIKLELDLAKRELEDSIGILNAKPLVQILWTRLSAPNKVYNTGWLRVNPQKINFGNLQIRNDSLHILLGLTARPDIRFEKPAGIMTLVPDLEYSVSKPGFSIFLDAVLHYDSLSIFLNKQLSGREFELDKGKSKKKVIVKECRLYGSGTDKLIIKMSFTGSKEGLAYFTGKPFYDEQKKIIEIRDIDFDIKTKNLFLKTADWLFNRRMVNEISRVARFNTAPYEDSARFAINKQLNQEWIKGISSTGSVHELKITGFYPLAEHLIIRTHTRGEAVIRIGSVDFDF